MRNKVFGVIIAGGRGERLWPLSRRERPKQFLSLGGRKTLLEETVERILPLTGEENILVVTSEEQVKEVKRVLPWLGEERILQEPLRRNTAPAITWAGLWIEERGGGIMVVLPSDHVIREGDKFRAVVQKGIEYAERESVLVTIGILPTRPETGYGYIEVGERIEEGVWRVARFVEKPDEDTARTFLERGNFFWNSGMFIWRSESILKEVRKYEPAIYEGLKKLSKESIRDIYSQLPDISIDYAVMERSSNIFMVKGEFFWDDVGSWLALRRIGERDEKGNVSWGNNLLLDTENSVVVGSRDKLIALLGVKGIVVVDTPQALLVMEEKKAQEVKRILREIEGKKDWEKYL